ncbi:cellulase family glycosylhydrolase [Mycobacterium hackensackense]|uniref:glycoside hydrolase family 5 protein n=1 Tax=Mycobacterium hackensackense TaxID=228909 RepID=UPI00226584D0|nr:glycoside hydrolase family 5 protein [Mycobacterium hackensackense]MCV7255509.1 cellulase family glycosylhydrolase [Mycobacterium hackensackense]
MRAGIAGMFWHRMVLGVVAMMGLAVLGGTADRQIAAAHQVALVGAIDDSPTTVGLADSNLARLGDEAAITKQLDMMQSIGIQNVRIGVSWATLQPRQGGGYNWGLTNYDYIVDQALKRGMGVLAVLHETPTWAGDRLGSGMPTDVTTFGNFTAEVAAHFEGRVADYEVWNEPNAKFFLDPVSPANYTSLLKEAYTRIKGVDQNITVIGGVLGFGFTLTSPDGTTRTMNPVDFLDGMYAAGAHGYFDALSFHPYKPDIKFSDQEGNALTPLAQLEKMRQLMEQYGDGALKIWATEYGLPTVPGEISQEQQADFIKDFLNNWGKVDGTGPIFIYTTRDLDTGSSNEQDNYGIWETDWTPKLAVEVIKDFIASQNGNPILDFIRNAIVNLAKITGVVIKGIANATVRVVNALVDATVWVVKTIAKVTGAVVKGIVDVTKRVATAICNTVHAVVDRIQDVFNRNDPLQAPTSLAGARSLNTAAARLTTTAAEVGTATVPKDQQSETAAADLNRVSEVAVTGEVAKRATGITADTTKDVDTKEIPYATTEVKATTATEISTKEPATKDAETVELATEQTTATTAPVAEKAAAASTTKTEATKTEATKKDEDETASATGTTKTGTVKATTSTKQDTPTGGSTTDAAGTSGQQSSPNAGANAGSASSSSSE